MPRISVVVPIFDVESYLATCLQSLAGQTVRDLEVIMVDDGSTDGSRALAERFACHDRRFRLRTQANYPFRTDRRMRVPRSTYAWSPGEHEVALDRTRRGDAALVTRKVVTPIFLPADEPALTAPAPA